jgi:monofunctional glycosyltransferase
MVWTHARRPGDRGSRRSRRWVRWLAYATLGVLAASGLAGAALWLSLPDVGRLATKPPATTSFIELRRREADRAGQSFRLRWTWRPLYRISPYLRAAVVFAEDARFFTHAGVDWDAVRDAADTAWKERRLSRGGSTITQQLAKNLYLTPSRSPIRKLRELFIARRLEAALTKERILELYLNTAEWGDGVFGAEAAARHWYRKSASSVTPAQAARLAVALPNPLHRNPHGASRALDRKAARLVKAMRRRGVISEAQADEALAALGVHARPERPDGEPQTAAADSL